MWASLEDSPALQGAPCFFFTISKQKNQAISLCWI